MGILMETTEVQVGTARYLSVRREPQLFGEMGAPDEFYTDTFHTIAINTRETEFGSIVEPIPITLKAYKPYQPHQHPLNGYAFPPHQTITSLMAASRMPEHPCDRPSASVVTTVPINDAVKDVPKLNTTIRPPPKKKWIRDYLEEEPKSPVSVRVVSVGARSNGLVRAATPPSSAPLLPVAPAAAPPETHQPVVAPLAPAVAAPLLDFAQEHSRPRTTSNSHGSRQIPSPPSVSSNGSSGSGGGSGGGSAPRAGTREVHNKLEKNRRAHLKECFELLKRQLPATPEDKKTSNLSILGSAIRYIQVLRRKERECEHEMERLAREKIAAQQRLAALKREVTVRAVASAPSPVSASAPASASAHTRTLDPISDEKDMEEHVNGQILGISIGASPPRPLESPPHPAAPPHSLNLSTKLRTLPIQITPTTSQQVVRSSYGARHNTLTLTTLAPADGTTQQNGQQLENGVTNGMSTTLVHPAQIHLPLSQVVSSGGLVVGGAALQLLSTGAGLRVLQAPLRSNGVTTGENNRIPKAENGIVATSPVSSTDAGSVVVSGLAPLVVSQPTTHLLQTHTLTHKMVETAMVKGSVSVSAQYLSTTTLVKPVVVVSSAPDPPPDLP